MQKSSNTEVTGLRKSHLKNDLKNESLGFGINNIDYWIKLIFFIIYSIKLWKKNQTKLVNFKRRNK